MRCPEETKRLRDAEQTRLCDAAYERALDLLARHREPLDRLAAALLERETLDRGEVSSCCCRRAGARRRVRAIGTLLALFDQP